MGTTRQKYKAKDMAGNTVIGYLVVNTSEDGTDYYLTDSNLIIYELPVNTHYHYWKIQKDTLCLFEEEK